MTKQLYEEALADVKKLKEVAEDNAKRALLEAVTPRIRDLIENQLLGELGELEADPEDILMDDAATEDNFEESPVVASPQTGDAASSAASISAPDEEGKVTLDLDALKTDDAYELSLESAASLGVLIASSGDLTFDSKMEGLNKKIDLVNKTGKLVRESKGFEAVLSSIVAEVEDTYSYLQNMQACHKKSSYESILENYYSTLKQLTEQKMKKNQKTLSEADVTLKLTGMPDDLDLEALGVDLITGDEEEGEAGEEAGVEADAEAEADDDELDLGSEDSDESEDELDLGDEEDTKEESVSHDDSDEDLDEDAVVEIDESMLRREIARMKALRETADMPKNAAKGHGPGEVADGFEDDDLGDPLTDVKLTTESDEEELEEMDVDQSWNEQDELGEQDDLEEQDMDQAYAGMDQSEKRRAHPGHDPRVMQPNVQKDMPESIQRKIDSEIALQTEAKKKAAKAKKLHKEQQAKEKAAKKPADKKEAKKAQAKLKEAYNYYANKFNESVARTNKLKGMLAEAAHKGAALNGTPKSSAAETNLRNKLAETNLFNAKLLFTNKLLQNESLTKRQKAEIIERLDEAKSEREVKLVYESLVKTLSASTSKITESTERGVIGSASRPSRSAASTSTLNEGFESDRWARLAGIIK
jgi:hypothetical protein